MQTSVNKVAAKLSLLPLLTFVALFLGAGLYLQSQGVDYAFYQLPAPVAILPAIAAASVRLTGIVLGRPFLLARLKVPFQKG